MENKNLVAVMFIVLEIELKSGKEANHCGDFVVANFFFRATKDNPIKGKYSASVEKKK